MAVDLRTRSPFEKVPYTHHLSTLNYLPYSSSLLWLKDTQGHTCGLTITVMETPVTGMLSHLQLFFFNFDLSFHLLVIPHRCGVCELPHTQCELIQGINKL